MAEVEIPRTEASAPGGAYVTSAGTLAAAALAVCAAQTALAAPAVLNGLFQQDLGTSASQLTWITVVIFLPVCLFELTFGVLGDLFGRKRLLVGGALLMAVGEVVAVLTPGAGSSTGIRVLVLWTGLVVTGIGAAAVFPASLAMVAAGTHTARSRARAIAIWAAALAAAGLVSPVLGGLTAKIGFGADPHASWRWTLLAILVLALVSAAVSLAAAQDSAAPEGRSLDWPGQVTIGVALFAFLYAVIQGPTSGWGSGPVIAGFIVAPVFLVLFILAERRSAAPLLRLDFFTHRAFAVNAVVTVVAMFAFLGTGYSTSIRLTAIQGYTPLKASIAFICLSVPALVLLPVTARLLERYNPRWVLGSGCTLIGAGALWLAAVPADGAPAPGVSLAVIVAPLVITGIGFALAVSSVTAVAVNTMPNHLAGMASGTTSMLRDIGFTLGPAVISAVALSQAAARISGTLAGSASLRGAVAAFTGAAAHAPAAQRPELEAAVHAVQSGPLGANAVPATVTVPGGHVVPFNPLKDVAFHALSHAYSTAYLISGLAALAAALLAFAGLGGSAHDTQADPHTLTDEAA
jgi:MFS family permease